MPKCPKCGSEIDELIVYCKEISKYRVWLHSPEDEHPSWERIDALESEDVGGYECPECGEQLFKDYHEAIAFLKGEM